MQASIGARPSKSSSGDIPGHSASGERHHVQRGCRADGHHAQQHFGAPVGIAKRRPRLFDKGRALSHLPSRTRGRGAARDFPVRSCQIAGILLKGGRANVRATRRSQKHAYAHPETAATNADDRTEVQGVHERFLRDQARASATTPRLCRSPQSLPAPRKQRPSPSSRRSAQPPDKREASKHG